jgi:hypothetical protein
MSVHDPLRICSTCVYLAELAVPDVTTFVSQSDGRKEVGAHERRGVMTRKTLAAIIASEETAEHGLAKALGPFSITAMGSTLDADTRSKFGAD